jgi:hypothetical protein
MSSVGTAGVRAGAYLQYLIPDSLRDCSSSTVRCRPSRNLIVMTWNDPIRRRRSRLAHFLFRYRYIVSGAKTAMSMAHDKSNQPI